MVLKAESIDFGGAVADGNEKLGGPMLVAFIDFTKVYDKVDSRKLCMGVLGTARSEWEAFEVGLGSVHRA